MGKKYFKINKNVKFYNPTNEDEQIRALDPFNRFLTITKLKIGNIKTEITKGLII